MQNEAYSYTVDEALLSLGFGKFQAFVLAYAGFGWLSEAMEMMLLSFIGPSIRTEWGISDGQESLISSVVFAGMLIGACTWGFISDNYGRRMGFLCTATTTSLAGFMSAVAPNYSCLITLRFLVGVGLGGCHVLSSWFLEFIPAPNRGAWMIVFTLFWPVGSVFQAAVAWVVMPVFGWRWLVALSSLPSFLLLLFFKVTPESPRYLCKRGKLEEARLILTRIASLNQASLPPGLLCTKSSQEEYVASSSVHMTETSPLIITKERNGLQVFLYLLSPSLLRSTVLLWLVFMGNAFGYYGIVLLTSELSSTNRRCKLNPTIPIQLQDESSLYRNVFITSSAELPGLLLSAFTVDKIGRKASMYLLLFTCCAFLAPLIWPQKEVITTCLLFGARACVNASMSIIYIYAPEMYPTSMRSTGLGVGTAMGRIGGMVCPLVAVSLVENCHQTEAIFLFELIIFVTGVATILFPLETNGCHLIT
ncbi:Organic cation/carnitine transporter 7 [Rhynchospora pubera]|uniref:Organic cation/carnitine transporter 7 n=1 Tax=Rhynchospora pubera TaxID=906938 RepID=A0AAV8G8J5_9POAL|nr:Organic cation/carnitine transporter 7 [Rhynchospora pubera]